MIDLMKHDIHIRPDVTLIDTIKGVTSCKPTNITVELWNDNDSLVTTVKLEELIDAWKKQNARYVTHAKIV